MAEKKNEKKKKVAGKRSHLEGKYSPFKLSDRKKPTVVDQDVLDARINEAEDELQKMGIEHDVWLKQPLFNDPSYYLCFSKLEDPDGIIMLQQLAGESLRLLDAPPFLKQSGVKQLDALIEFASIAQDVVEEEG